MTDQDFERVLAGTEVPVVVDFYADWCGPCKAMAQARLDRVAEALRARGITVTTRVLTGVGPANLLLEEAGSGRYDLVAMTTHGQGGLRRLLLGSVTDKVVRGATCPVLALRPGAML